MTSLSEAARTYIGVPFKHQGRTRAGLDCAGLVIAAVSDTGRNLIDARTGYGRLPSNGILEDTLSMTKDLVRMPKNTELEKDDILAFRFTDEPQHLAIYTGESLIHSITSVGKVAEHKFVGFWKKRVAAVYRFVK